MTREIKFRAKTTQDGEWVYGLPYKTTADGKVWCITYYKEHGGMSAPNVDKKTIGQFTGLKDKDGKDIYEGDIVESHRESHEITFGAGCFGTKTKEGFITYSTSWSIIGNIHDNPELLNP